ncbi:hypothetical protein MLD38_028210 [Melastoma candidum]|uniref:Uncharacterized protein n=1 Tax=Melastoma candidum TaxID=119954 RepID=A0ACB9N064_9MYRT|nr:hypothetical protein MLD38_028210 [Melastoma candidum]
MLLEHAEPGLYTTFRRLFVCFHPLLQGFLLGCIRFAGFDGTFLKHKVGGISLTEVGCDENNGMFPIAWAAVEGENYNSWMRFMELLFKLFDVGSGHGWTFISNQQKGLLNALSILALDAEHRNCSRHIYQN